MGRFNHLHRRTPTQTGGETPPLLASSIVSSPELLVVHALRLKGFADAATLAEAAGVSVGDAEPILNGLVDAEHARFRDGARTGYSLTKEGRAYGEELLRAELAQQGVRDVVDAAYRRFLEHNQNFLALCTDWQTRTVDGAQVLNDHADAEYDAGILKRLEATDEAIQPICADLHTSLDRFGAYGPKLGNALAKVRAGERDWFTKPMIESYHTMWFELHEDLLATLGIERTSEGKAG